MANYLILLLSYFVQFLGYFSFVDASNITIPPSPEGIKSITVGPLTLSAYSPSNRILKPFLGHPMGKCPAQDIRTFFQNKGKELSSGVDGQVFPWPKASPGNLPRMVVKRITKNEHYGKEEFYHEKDILTILRGEGVTPDVVCQFKDKEAFYFVMDYIEGKTLSEVTEVYQPLKESLPKKWISISQGMVDVVEHLHRQNLVHLDLHLDNWMVDVAGRMYLIDFSRARRISSDLLPTFMCVAPETRYESTGKKYSTKSDIWSLGETLTNLLEKMLALKGKMVEQQEVSTLTTKYHKVYFPHGYPYYLLDQMKEKKPELRLDVTQVKAALKQLSSKLS